MKLPLSILPLLVGFAGNAIAQAPAQRPQPARQEAIASPEICEDRSVTFRLRAPQAGEVVLRGQWRKQAQPLVRAANGVWTLTTEPIEAGVWEYSFAVDGLNLIDPANPALKPQREPGKNILHIAATPPNPWDFQDVPHGAVHQHSYLSKPLGRARELRVYTPPGYETDAGTTKYPLFVLQHGSGDNHRTWVEHGKAHWILDHLIAAGMAKPMIVLMIDGHPQGQVPREDADKRAASLAAFQRELFEDALPLVEARYRVSADREQRAIAGLSMGGWQALNVGLNNLDRFAWVGSFSGAAEEATLAGPLADPKGTDARLKLLWIAVGRDDFLRERNESLIGALKASGIDHEWRLTDGDHSWPVWRRYLVEFAPKLFQH